MARRRVPPFVRRAHGIVTRELPFAAWRAWSRARHGATRPVRLADGTLVVRSDDYRGFRIAQLGGTQQEKVRAWKDVVACDPDVVVDVGANYGEFTLAAAVTTTAPVLAVEANPVLVDCLRQTFAGRANVEVVHAAAAAEAGTASFWTQTRSSGSGSLGKGAPELERRNAGARGVLASTAVDTVRLDELLPARLGRAPRSLALKVDVEGFEADVFAGLGSLLDELDWWRALVEFGPATAAAAGKDPAEVWKLLSSHAGVVVSVAGSTHHPDVRWSPGAVLPADPPGEVDVLIGRGEPTRGATIAP